MDLINHDGLVLFDFNLPIYNWFFPLNYDELEESIKLEISDNNFKIFEHIGNTPKNRALYFHIPFCQDICSFCPFSRQVCNDEALLNKYTDAIVKEIYIKGKYKNISNFPINSIFFGGGTPSILKPKHIIKIGNAIKNCFDLSELKEFSFEMNAKTVTPERVSALKDIGVSHARMGVQTFNPKYRRLFSLSATLDQIYQGAALLNNNFDNVCIDMLYGMHGQTQEEFLKDLHHATKLNTPNIDVYPINNFVTQPKLNLAYKEENLKPSSGLTKFTMNLLLNEYMRNNGYLPHNGHGYVKANQELINQRPVVTDKYRFQYHEAVYGYQGHEIIGFGTNAFSSFDGFVIGNCNDTPKYINNLLNNDLLDMFIYKYDKNLCESKGIILHLPYHGEVDKRKLNFELIYPEVLARLEVAMKSGLIIEDTNSYKLTQLGWYWYVNLLYYLSPQSDQDKLIEYIGKKGSEESRSTEDWQFSLDF